MKWIDKKIIVDKFIKSVEEYPCDFKFISESGGGAFQGSRGEVATLSQCQSAFYLDSLESRVTNISVHFAFGMSGTVACSWQVHVNNDCLFRIGFILGFRVKRAIKRLNKIKVKSYESKLNEMIEG